MFVPSDGYFGDSVAEQQMFLITMPNVRATEVSDPLHNAVPLWATRHTDIKHLYGLALNTLLMDLLVRIKTEKK